MEFWNINFYEYSLNGCGVMDFFDIRYFFLLLGRNLKTLAKENKQKNLK